MIATAASRQFDHGPADHGIGRVTRLGDAVGYMEFTAFECSAAARELVRAAFRRFADARALILDLRRHKDGDESAAALITSHFFATESMAQERFASTPRVHPRQRVPRLLSATIDVLVSRETSPLGRAFAANLERLGRARVVGPAPRRWAPRARGARAVARKVG